VSNVAEIVDQTELTVLSGDDPLTLPMASLGAKGVVSVVSNLIPDRIASMCSAFLEDDWETAQSINAEILPLARALLSLDSNPVPLKIALRLLGRDSGAVRLPLCEPNDTVIAQIENLLKAYDFEPAHAAL